VVRRAVDNTKQALCFFKVVRGFFELLFVQTVCAINLPRSFSKPRFRIDSINSSADGIRNGIPTKNRNRSRHARSLSQTIGLTSNFGAFLTRNETAL
jgi:hypothetical protein